jgi:hypothetical protein
MAAGRARSCYFKNEALKDLFGFDSPDSTAATVEPLLMESGFNRVCIDNVMQMTKLLRDFRADSLQKLSRWLSYFLRVDCSVINKTDLLELGRKLSSYIVRSESLSEELYGQLTLIPALQIGPRSEVLPHKSVIYSYRRDHSHSSL